MEDSEVDGALVDFMNDRFFAGLQAHVGERLLAALLSEVPEFWTTPRAWRCLRGWRRLCPSRSRRPYPLSVWAAMANELTRQGYKAYGSRSSPGIADVPETGRVRPVPQGGLDQGQEGGTGQLELDRVSARKRPPDQDGCLGRQCPPGLRIVKMDEGDMATAEKVVQTDTNCNPSGSWNLERGSGKRQTRCPSRT